MEVVGSLMFVKISHIALDLFQSNRGYDGTILGKENEKKSYRLSTSRTKRTASALKRLRVSSPM